jgi:hypothetical protein
MSPPYPGTFVVAFRSAANSLGLTVGRWNGQSVDCAGPDGREHTVFIDNLFRRARRGERSTWPELITEFLQTILSADREGSFPEDLCEVADRLLFRLGPPPAAISDDARVWAEPLGKSGLFATLVIDYPDRLCYVTDVLVQKSQQSGTHWLERARANLQARTPADCFQIVHEESGLLLCAVADAYDSSRALLLADLLPAGREAGFFVALPGRDELLVLPVSLAALSHVHLLKVLAEKNFKGTPYPISNQVYWIHERRWHHFPIAIRGQGVTVEPPEEFIALLKEMAPDDGPAESDGDEERTSDDA